MADPLLDLLLRDEAPRIANHLDNSSTNVFDKYLSRLLSLRVSDLTTTEPESLSQSSHSNLLAIQALSARSQRSTIASSDQLANLKEEIPTLTHTVANVKQAVPQLDESAVTFASTYSRARTGPSSHGDDALSKRKEAMLFTRQADKLQDILDLPSLLRTAIASAANGPAGSANYTQALDLMAHIRRLRILYPDSQLIHNVQDEAEDAMRDMTKSLLNSLRSQNIRLAAAIRTIGWLRRVVPELSTTSVVDPRLDASASNALPYSHTQEEQSEGSLGALFLVARLNTFLSMTEDALAPLRDLADQETEKRITSMSNPQGVPSGHKASSAALQGQQTERYLKRYVEIFREQSFATIQMFRNIFPQPASTASADAEDSAIRLPSALASFPLHLVSLLMETLQKYLPNVTDMVARESLLIQVLYAANSLGRLGADFSMFIAMLDLPEAEGTENAGEREPEWYRIIQKHRVQAARLDALALGQERRASQDVAAR